MQAVKSPSLVLRQPGREFPAFRAGMVKGCIYNVFWGWIPGRGHA